MDYKEILLITVAVLTAGLSFFIARGEKRDSSNVFALFILAIGLWSFGLAFFRLASDVFTASNYARFFYISALAIPAFFLSFSYLFPEKKQLKNLEKLLLYFIPILLAVLILSFPNFILRKVIITAGGLKDAQVNPIGYGIYTFYFISYLVIAYRNLFHSYFSSNDRMVKTQLRFIFIGTIVPYILAMIFNLVLPSFNYQYVWVGPLFAVVVVWAIMYAVYKHKLFEAKIVATEVFTFGLWIFIFVRALLAEGVQEKAINAVLLLLTVIIGIFLIRSVRKEVETREKIETLAKDLEKANDRLKELDQLKSEFVSLATHQIRGPLTAIKGYASLILEGDYGEVPQKLKEPIDTIFQSSQSLAVVVEDFLDVSRIEQGRMKYDFTTFDLRALVNQVSAELRPNIEKKGLSLSVSECAEPVNIKGDAGKIKQVIGNLLDNATKYTPKGSISVSLAPDQVSGKVILAIKDTGVGIKPETIPHLFQKFSRAEDASKVNILGTGLGLYVAKEMIKAHGGRVWVESEGEGKGSTFFVELGMV